MKKTSLLILFCSLSLQALATGDGWNSSMTIFAKGDTTRTNAYRIPAITTTAQKTILAVSDFRHYGSGDIGTNAGRQKVDFAIKVSKDGGTTWTEKNIVTPNNGLGISDPAIVHNSDTGKTFLFGYQNTKFITDKSGNFDFLMYTSEDGGITWDKGKSLKNLLPKGYKYLLQGPGGGMYYDGTIYTPIQAWHHKNDGKGITCTSGFMYSSDNGKTWETAFLRPEWLPEGEGIDITSESNIFHHNGKIYLAAKPETRRENKKRVVYSTADNGKTWERVQEDFIPDDVAACESSSLSLNDDVYLVAYTRDKPTRRQGIFVSTNTGKKLQIFESQSMGYTSMAQDLDNIYVLFEGSKDTGDIFFRRFDISAKEYANVNAQILKRSQELSNIQEKLFTKDAYLSGSYGSGTENELETVLSHSNYKIAAFHKKSTKNSENVYRTIDYTTENTTLVLSQDQVITKEDNLFVGYQYSKLNYINKSKNDINSFITGYSFKHKFDNEYTYNMAINAIYSNNKLKRNPEEGLGKTASFDSYSIHLKNALSKNITFQGNSLTFDFGLNTSIFGHKKIEEKNGNAFNDASVAKSKNLSNELFFNMQANKSLQLLDKLSLNLGAQVEYKKELMKVENWRDTFYVLDVERKFSTPVKDFKAGVGAVTFFTNFDINKKVEIEISHKINTLGKNTTTGKLTYKF